VNDLDRPHTASRVAAQIEGRRARFVLLGFTRGLPTWLSRRSPQIGPPPPDRRSDRNEQHRATLDHHPANAACARCVIRSGACMHLLIAESPLPPCRGGRARTSDQGQAVSRPSDVKSRRDTTGHNEHKPAGQTRSAARPPQAGRSGYEKSGITWRRRERGGWIVRKSPHGLEPPQLARMIRLCPLTLLQVIYLDVLRRTSCDSRRCAGRAEVRGRNRPGRGEDAPGNFA